MMDVRGMHNTILFSDRQAVMDSIINPAASTDRKQGEKWTEHEAHWQARAVLVTLSRLGLLTVEYDDDRP